MSNEVTDFLDQSSGSKYPAYKWGGVGQILSGEIIETPRIVSSPNLNTKQPEDNLVISIRTAEGHEFTLWVRRGFLASAISDAVKETSAKGLTAGGKLSVKHVEDRDTGKPQPARVFKARYEPPATPAVNPDDIFGEKF